MISNKTFSTPINSIELISVLRVLLDMWNNMKNKLIKDYVKKFKKKDNSCTTYKW